MNNDTKLIVELIKGMGKRLDDMKKEIEGVKSSYQYGSKVSKEFFDKACLIQDERNNEQQKQIDNHCSRLRDNAKKLSIMEIEMKPIRRLYNKFIDFVIGFIIIIGSLAIGAILFLKDKLN